MALGVAAGYGLNSGKTNTTSVVQILTMIRTQTTTAVERTNLTQTSTIKETQTDTAVQTVNVTITPYCCNDRNLTITTPCNLTIAPPVTPCTAINSNYPPVQRLQYLIETDPNFIAAENGLNYVSNGGLGFGFVANNAGGRNYTIQFSFLSYTNTSYTDDCGNIETFTYYLNVVVPLTETGYNMSAIQISPSNSSEITVDCTTSIVFTTENVTVTITGTTSS